MSAFTYSIAFDIAGEDQVVSAINATSSLDSKVLSLQSHVSQTGATISSMGSSSASAISDVGDEAQETGGDLQSMGKKGSSAFSDLKREAGGFIAKLAVMKFTMDSLKLEAEFQGIETAIKFASGAEGEKNLKFLDQSIDALGLNVRSATEGYKLWTGSIRGSALEGQKGRDTFYAVSEAVTAMQLTGDQSTGTFLALSQMMSKGKIQAEELRGQLAERIPGAFRLASESMGVTEAEMNKMLEKGEVLAEDFLPKFASKLHETFGGAAITQSKSATANFNRMGKAIHTLKRRVGEELLPTVTAFMTDYLIPAVDWVGENIKVLGLFASVITGAYLAVRTYNTVTAIAKGVNALMTGSIWGMNAALWANPIVWVIGLVVGLAAGVVYAWNKFEGFRAFLFASWEVIKETGQIIYDWLIQPFVSLGKIMTGVFTLDKDLIQEGITDVANSLESVLFESGDRLAGAWKQGWKDGVEDFNDSDTDAITDLFKSPDALSKNFKQTAGGTTDNNDDGSVTKGINSITGGGKQSKYITINLRNLVEGLNINSSTVSEGADKMEEIIMSKLLQVLNTANQTQ